MGITIIAGSRGITDYELVVRAIKNSGFTITEVVSGQCKNSPDILGERWAKERGIPIKPFPADWNDLSKPDAVIKTNKQGKKYDARAGFRRNREMAEYAASKPDGCAIILFNGATPGSTDMKEVALNYDLNCYFVRVSSSQSLPLFEGKTNAVNE